jgi:hypothetical protein
MKFILSIVLCLVCILGYSQITVSSATLPEPGDVLTYFVMASVEDSTMYKVNGENQSWAYSGLNYDGTVDEIYTDISGTAIGDSFPSGNVAIDFAGFTTVAEITDTDVEVIGLANNPLQFITMDSSAIRFSDRFTLKKTPFTYLDSYEDDFEIIFTFAASLVPGLDSIPIPFPGATLDSVRVRILNYRKEEATAYGTLNFNSQSIEVIKIEQQDTIGTVLEAGISFLGSIIWLDATALVGDMADDFGGVTQNTMTYKFQDADSKETILEFREDMVQDTSGNPIIQRSGRASFDIVSSDEDIIVENSDYKINPNPSSDFMRIAGKAGKIDVTLIAQDGRIIKQYHQINSGTAVDVSLLNKGLYHVIINDKNGSTTKSFVKK